MTVTDPDPLADPHQAALYYAALGWRVLPIRPGTKYPAGIGRWQDAATTDPQIIGNWWTQLYAGHGVGVATGPESGIWVLDVDVADGKTGDDTLNDLEDTYGPLPDTVEAITGRGGRHIFYRYPHGMKVSAGAATRLGPGLDVRGWGGQVLVAPTVGPTGGAYTWVIGHEPGHMPVADAPGWLLALIEEPEALAPTAAPVPPAGDSDSIAAAFNAATTWPELLERDGWTLHHVDPDGEQHWTRPGKERRDGTSATVGYRGNDALKVFTSSIPELEAERAYSRFGYEAAIRHRGDRSVLASHLRRAQQAAGPDPVQWARDAMNATPAPAPEPAEQPALAIRWVDDLDRHAMPPEPPVLVDGLLRRGEMCVFGAPRAIGKTWLAYNLAIRLAEGHGQFLGHLEVQQQARVLYLQGELDQWGSAMRWKLLTGAASPLPHVAETFDRLRFRTVKRRVTILGTAGTTGTEEYTDAHIDERLEAAIIDHDIDVVIVDPWAVYLAGAENSNDDVEAVLGALREITLRTGVAWVIIHHITGKAERSSWTEPEDLWRGATRLADWASTRVTVLPHYTEAQYKELGLSRREARRHAKAYFLRRSTPTDDFTMRLDQGWWNAWTPDDDPPGTTPLLDLARRLHDAGGTWTSYRQAADDLGVSPHTIAKLVTEAALSGLVTVDDGPRNSTIIRLTDTVDHPWAPRVDRASTARRAVDAENAQWDARSESVPDQEEPAERDTSPRDDRAQTTRGAKPQVECGEQRPRATPPPTEGGPPDVDHPHRAGSRTWLADPIATNVIPEETL